MQLDLDRFLAPIDDSAPTGQNLEYDPAFVELERIATPVSERAMGESIKAAVEPDWDKVADAADALLARTKDLRVALHLSAAWTRKAGLDGWAAGLGLVRGLLERYWDDVHPQLDADDDNDATARANALMALGNPQSVLGYFRAATFVQSVRLGRFSLRDLRVATGMAAATPSADGASAPSLVDLEAACMDCPEDELPRTAALLADALEHAESIDALLGEKLGTSSPDLSHLPADIRDLKKFVDAQRARRFPEQQYTDSTGGAPETQSGGTDPIDQPRSRGIAGPDDVRLRIDEICEYYERNEPSSPLPILLKRARRLVGKNFVEIMQDITPGGLSELQTLSGSEVD